METAVEDDAGRDPGPDPQVDQVVGRPNGPSWWSPTAAARTSFSTTHGTPRAALEAASERQVLPAEVDRERDVAGRPLSTRPGNARARRPRRRPSSRRPRRPRRGSRRRSGRWPRRARPTAAGTWRRAQTVPSASTTRTAILLPPMSTPTRRRGASGGRRSAGGARASSSDEAQAELAGDEQGGRAADDDVRRRPGDLDVDVVGEEGEGPAAGLAPDRGEPAIAELGDRAEEDDPLDVEGADQAGDRPAERRAGVVGDRDRPGLARVDRGADARRGRSGGRWRRPPGPRSRACPATVSRQPVRPQRQSAPSSSTTMWPISPAPEPSPWNSAPRRIRPAPTPRPTRIAIRFGTRRRRRTCTRRGRPPGSRWRR